MFATCIATYWNLWLQPTTHTIYRYYAVTPATCDFFTGSGRVYHYSTHCNMLVDITATHTATHAIYRYYAVTLQRVTPPTLDESNYDAALRIAPGENESWRTDKCFTSHTYIKHIWIISFPLNYPCCEWVMLHTYSSHVMQISCTFKSCCPLRGLRCAWVMLHTYTFHVTHISRTNLSYVALPPGFLLVSCYLSLSITLFLSVSLCLSLSLSLSFSLTLFLSHPFLSPIHFFFAHTHSITLFGVRTCCTAHWLHSFVMPHTRVLSLVYAHTQYKTFILHLDTSMCVTWLAHVCGLTCQYACHNIAETSPSSSMNASSLQHTTTYYNTLQYTAKHTATHSDTSQHCRHVTEQLNECRLTLRITAQDVW